MKVLRVSILILALAIGLHAQLVIPPITAECATSIDGSVVLVPNPLNPPVIATGGTGTLGSGTYYVEIAWYDAAAHVTLVGPEVQVALLSTGNIQVSPPSSGMPATAVGTQVFIGATSGGETLQGSAVGSATYTQSVPLVVGTAIPASNNTVCQAIANDAGWPSGTGYVVTVTSPAGGTLPGYPMQWQLLGPGNTINLGNGLPLYNGTVTYPIPILSRPYGHGPQSISGPLSMTTYNLTSVGKLGVGTAVPSWGIDVEGAASANSRINANGGYLVNGTAPGANTCLGSTDGVANDVQIPCLSSAFYQTIDLNAVAQTQRPVLNFTQRFTATDSASPARTTIDANAPGTGNLIATYASDPGASTSVVAFDGNKNLTTTTIGASFNAPHKVTSVGDITMTTNGTVYTLLTESVTMPASTGTYRVLVSYSQWFITGGNVCSAEVVDTTNNYAWAFSQHNDNGLGYSALVGSEVSTQTYAASATATFTLKAVCAGSSITAAKNSASSAVLSPNLPSYLSVTPVLTN